jgi:nicotinate-nucleotide pyrophosphorylase (carboxylating)
MLDNFSPEGCKVACALINNEVETEASGGINIHNVKEYANSGVNYISVGALTHSVNALDINFKTKIQA